MLVYDNDKLLKTYNISLGHNPIGDKVYEGDNKTPEGNFIIDSKNSKSTCYKNLGISYPDKKHIDFAKSIGKTAGGNIKIHGLPNKEPYWGKFHRLKNWTNGCVGVTNEEIDELYYAVNIGTPIIIKQ
jgi:murein L,D-transpeptidase YafK